MGRAGTLICHQPVFRQKVLPGVPGVGPCHKKKKIVKIILKPFKAVLETFIFDGFLWGVQSLTGQVSAFSKKFVKLLVENDKLWHLFLYFRGMGSPDWSSVTC